MLFSSNIFLFFFLPAVVLGYHLIGRFGRIAVFSWLSFASLFFYGYWNPKYLFLLLASIALNFSVARLIGWSKVERTRTVLLASGITANLALLVWFKYLFPSLMYFHNAGWLSRSFGSVVLPLGISFFTFTQIAYLVDLKQGAAELQGLLSYVLFVTFFPHLIAGPILHHKQMMPQFQRDRRGGLRADDFAVGFTWFVLGLSKKVLIADRFAPVADEFYRNPQVFGIEGCWAGILAYAMQLYFDFSGYSDMAIGLARMFSITFPINFNSPFKATNISDYWQRWHMTLTQYIMSYVYAPVQLTVSRWRQNRGLKVSRRAQATLPGMLQMVLFPTLFTMSLAGVWHGAGLQFLLYGLLHGLYLTIFHVWKLMVSETSILRRILVAPFAVLLTFLCVVLGFVLFRASSVHQAITVYSGAFGRHPDGARRLSGYLSSLPLSGKIFLHAGSFWFEIGLLLFVVWCLPNTQEIMDQVELKDRGTSLVAGGLRWTPSAGWAFVVMFLTGYSLILLRASTSFLYFQF
jgi:alginate O-acetyltransferase complex protein AlgI